MKFTRTLLIFLAGVGTAIAGTAISNSQFFSDVPTGEYFYESVQNMANKGIIQGYGNSRFGPHDGVSRGQAAVLLHRYDKHRVAPLEKRLRVLEQKLGITPEPPVEPPLPPVTLCKGKYKPGESFPADDGCNTCTCSPGGLIACTEKACLPPQKDFCFSSDDCPAGKYCTTETGDCGSYHCQGDVCTTVCSGLCKPKKKEAVCGNGICEENEYVPCPPGAQCLWAGSCPEDCKGGSDYTCDEANDKFESVMADYKWCSTDADCTLFSAACPYVTCGEAINKKYLDKAKDKAEWVIDVCYPPGTPQACAGCLQTSVKCQNSQCVSIPE